MCNPPSFSEARQAAQAPQRPQAAAAALHGISVTTIKRMVAAGRVAGDPPPLHSVEEMEAWMGRMEARGVKGFRQRQARRCPGAPVVSQAAAAASFNVSVRQIKRWVAAGREAKDPPPFHDPELMKAWFVRMWARAVDLEPIEETPDLFSLTQTQTH